MNCYTEQVGKLRLLVFHIYANNMDIDENKGSRSQKRTKWGIIGEGLNYLTVFMSKYTLFHYTL